jgi:hypothetical protein
LIRDKWSLNTKFEFFSLHFLQYHPPQKMLRVNTKLYDFIFLFYFSKTLSTRLKVKQSSFKFFFIVILLITVGSSTIVWLTSSIFHYSIVLKRREKHHSADGIKIRKIYDESHYYFQKKKYFSESSSNQLKVVVTRETKLTHTRYCRVLWVEYF